MNAVNYILNLYANYSFYFILFLQFVLKTLLDKYHYKRETKKFKYDYVLYNFLLTIVIGIIMKYSPYLYMFIFTIIEKIAPRNFIGFLILLSGILILAFAFCLQRGFLTYLYNYLMYGDKMSESIELPLFVSVDTLLTFNALTYDIFNHFYKIVDYIIDNYYNYFKKISK